MVVVEWREQRQQELGVKACLGGLGVIDVLARGRVALEDRGDRQKGRFLDIGGSRARRSHAGAVDRGLGDLGDVGSGRVVIGGR